MKLLIIDDSKPVRVRLVAMLAGTPCLEIGEASNLADGIEYLCRAEPDAVVLDIQFAWGKGFELLSLVKRCSRSVLVLVSTNDILARQHCRTLGADYFFDKSFEFEQLVDKIVAHSRALLRGSRHEIPA
jgi:DNA-binding NarL/FixJ family response regulator